MLFKSSIGLLAVALLVNAETHTVTFDNRYVPTNTSYDCCVAEWFTQVRLWYSKHL